jgi:hypothetical protein
MCHLRPVALDALSTSGQNDAIAESVRRARSVRTTPPEADSLRRVIVVVEGPSGAGKTTWCRTHGGRFALLEEVPDHSTVPTGLEAQARFWVERNVARWAQVREREDRDGLVVVDVDPFKLHYVWTLWRTGQVPELEWDLQREASRKAFSAGEYALADLYLVSNIDEPTLRARRDADTMRTRRGFESHVRLRDSLLRWYCAIDELEPGRVRFELPDAGLTPDLLALGPRVVRSGADLFDQLLARLD